MKFDGIDGWLRSVGSAPAGTVIDERLANPVVHVDGNLASIWVDYWLFVGERFSHCGVDAILLSRHEGAWRIFSVVDTRRREGCAPAPVALSPRETDTKPRRATGRAWAACCFLTARRTAFTAIS